MREPFTLEEAMAVWTFDPEAGVLIWKERPESMFESALVCRQWNAKWAGKPIIYVSPNGYISVRYRGLNTVVHRVIWLISYGEWPKGEIDHIDHVKTNNRLVNLREVSHAENSRNQSIGSTNNSGVVGVAFRRDTERWVARIRHEQKSISLGSYRTKDEAVEARRAAERRLGFHPNHGTQAIRNLEPRQ